jgi:hypothetical protein
MFVDRPSGTMWPAVGRGVPSLDQAPEPHRERACQDERRRDGATIVSERPSKVMRSGTTR